MLYICIPTYNEAPTVGVLLWRIRKVFQEYSREYEVVIYDDGSTDGTKDTLEPYAEVLPLTVLRGETRRGYGNALNTLAREVSKRSRYPRRDAMVVMQGDFTDQPESLPDFIKRFEGGADIVVAERERSATDPVPVKRLRMVAPLFASNALKGKPAKDIKDPFSGFSLYRISLIRDLLKTNNESPVVNTNGWAANIQLLSNLSQFARRVETVGVKPRYDLRPRESRIRVFNDAVQLFKDTRPARLKSSTRA